MRERTKRENWRLEYENETIRSHTNRSSVIWMRVIFTIKRRRWSILQSARIEALSKSKPPNQPAIKWSGIQPIEPPAAQHISICILHNEVPPKRASEEQMKENCYRATNTKTIHKTGWNFTCHDDILLFVWKKKDYEQLDYLPPLLLTRRSPTNKETYACVRMLPLTAKDLCSRQIAKIAARTYDIGMVPRYLRPIYVLS